MDFDKSLFSTIYICIDREEGREGAGRRGPQGRQEGQGQEEVDHATS